MLNFQTLEHLYSERERACLLDQLSRYKNSKTQGTVLVCFPLVKNTLPLIQALHQTGIKVTASRPDGLPYDPEALKALEIERIPYLAPDQIRGTYDVIVDCMAHASKKALAKKFILELTRSGILHFEQGQIKNPDRVPVFSIDDNPIKQIEDMLGIADGLIRGLKAVRKTPTSLSSALIVGGGKVGQGAILGALRFAKKVAVVDPSTDALERIQNQFSERVKTISYDQSVKNPSLISGFDLIISATAQNEIITKKYDKKLFVGKTLVNLGAEDEWGSDYSIDEVENQKKPLNFILDEPTLIQYMDPTYALILKTVVLGLNGEFTNWTASSPRSKTVHPLPVSLSNPIIEYWSQTHLPSLLPSEISYIKSLIQ